MQDVSLNFDFSTEHKCQTTTKISLLKPLIFRFANTNFDRSNTLSQSVQNNQEQNHDQPVSYLLDLINT